MDSDTKKTPNSRTTVLNNSYMLCMITDLLSYEQVVQLSILNSSFSKCAQMRKRIEIEKPINRNCLEMIKNNVSKYNKEFVVEILDISFGFGIFGDDLRSLLTDLGPYVRVVNLNYVGYGISRIFARGVEMERLETLSIDSIPRFSPRCRFPSLRSLSVKGVVFTLTEIPTNLSELYLTLKELNDNQLEMIGNLATLRILQVKNSGSLRFPSISSMSVNCIDFHYCTGIRRIELHTPVLDIFNLNTRHPIPLIQVFDCSSIFTGNLYLKMGNSAMGQIFFRGLADILRRGVFDIEEKGVKLQKRVFNSLTIGDCESSLVDTPCDFTPQTPPVDIEVVNIEIAFGLHRHPMECFLDGLFSACTPRSLNIEIPYTCNQAIEYLEEMLKNKFGGTSSSVCRCRLPE